eukprot:265204-Rhodomonas_salina.1
MIGFEASGFIQRGRVSLSILVLAVYMIYLTSLAMIPKKIEIINISLYDPRSQIDEVKQDLLMRQALGWKRTQFVVAVVISTMSEYVTYGLELYKKHEEMASRQDDEEEGEDDDIGDSMYQEVEFESLSPAENIMMMLASYSAELVALLVYPFVILFIWWAEDIGLSLGALYDVRTTDFL